VIKNTGLLVMFLSLGGCCTTAPKNAGPMTHPPTQSKAATATPASVIEVNFEGLIAHIVPDDPAVATRRAVVFAGDSNHPHALTVSIPPVNEESDLAFIGNVQLSPDGGYDISVISPGLTFTIENLTPAFNKLGTFKALVPSLSDAHDPLGTPIPPTSLNADLQNPTPTPNGNFVAYFDYSGGTLTATSFCGKGQFKNKPGSPRYFVKTVTLAGETTASPILKVTRGRAQKSFTFKDPTFIEILVNNEAIAGSGDLDDHFRMYEGLFKPGTVTLPEVDHALACKHPKGTVVGCSDSQWP